jgi:uncharacterized membrane protein YphA (DoxX/SURF4 family)
MRALIRSPWSAQLALLLLCAAYLQGGLVKVSDLSAASAELAHLGLSPAGPMALAVIAIELGGTVLVVLGPWRWVGALGLAAFTAAANLMANAFWHLPAGPLRTMSANQFFEHLGLVGGFILVALWDLGRERR